ncbi:serine/threonine-protein kinase [Solwaraspora sp. WMMD792]|uniref:serine/threonine-protein kinase n=1 Tax=Solwaraspora sp. WMMD792 TaxID=3016099 RepID=UPI002415E1C8|nr:serine/threonine-protein kinase [Solwaraspora sp. WMMD792]MDG4774985.1 serine/threonine-protein kinase [Solwaraspora sp. WMMD792]
MPAARPEPVKRPDPIRRPEPINGRYELVEQIGPGGMGQVWRGYDAVLDREIAVKLIRTDVISSAEEADEFARRFRREARITARIGHHGVPQVYDAVLDESYDRVYLVMEYVRGTSLRAYVRPDAPLPVAWAAAVAAQICTVLSHAHAIPVVHRDLKPDNVLVTETGAVKVLDFGIAAILRTDVTRLTVTGQRLGTYRYMPPEQIRGGQVTPQTDLYALGCLLHELLAGAPLFSGGNEFELMQQHVYAEPVPLRSLRADVPEDVEQLVLDLCAKVAEQRPADAFDVYERLLPYLPPPGAPPAVAGSGREPAGVPDPTLLYRRPNAPRPRAEPTAAVDSAAAGASVGPEVPMPPQAGAAATALRDAINAAMARSNDLLGEERYTQAAAALAEVATAAGKALGLEHPRVLGLRKQRAAVLVLGNDFRAALPEFDALADAYARLKGPGSDEAMACLRQAAHCRAGLGQATAALRQFREVLAYVRDAEGDASDTALDLRRDIVLLLLAEQDIDQAAAELEQLHADLRVVYGPEHEDTLEVGDLLARLRLARQGCGPAHRSAGRQQPQGPDHRRR